MAELPQAVIKELDAILAVDWNRRNLINMVWDPSADSFARTFDVMIRNQEV